MATNKSERVNFEKWVTRELGVEIGSYELVDFFKLDLTIFLFC